MQPNHSTRDSLVTDWLEAIPRVGLGFLPTPLVPLDRLSQRLRGPRIWLKRDDCTGLATGGNKTRKLEYLLAEALQAGAGAVLTFGAVQSNHARQTAAACAAVGLPCHLVLTRRVRWTHPGYESSGNVLLDRLCGAVVHTVEPADAQARAREILDHCRARGLSPYVIPTGGSNPTGALGYVRCALELLEQSRELGFDLTDVVHASSSAGTQAGLLAGFAGLLPVGVERPRVHGVNVYEREPQRLADAVLAMARTVLDLRLHAGAAQPAATAIAPADVRLDSRHLGEDYGIPTPATLEAIRLAASTEGVLLDPVYSGKGFAGLLHGIRNGEFDGRSDVVFIHTGGAATLPVYERAFAEGD